MTRTMLALIACLSFAAFAPADNWPAWRGPNGDGRSAEKNLPTTWSDKQNVRWKIELPIRSHAAPIVWDDRIFLPQALDAKGHKRALWCLDRKDGKRLWERVVPYGADEPLHATNSFCAATPVTDGKQVIVSFGSAGVWCYDFDGRELWHYDLGKLWHIWGNASSPILYQNLVILWAGPGERQFLLALDKSTGKKVWQTDVPGGKDGITDKAWLGSWTTPIIAKIGQRDELILGVPKKLKAFDPATGKELWSCDGLGDLVYTSPAISKDGIVVAFSGFGGPALACKAGAGRRDENAPPLAPIRQESATHRFPRHPRRALLPRRRERCRRLHRAKDRQRIVERTRRQGQHLEFAPPRRRQILPPRFRR